MDEVSDRVDQAFARTPRPGFLPTQQRHRAAQDGPVAIGDDQTNSQPSTVAAMLRLLDVRPGQLVLDVGSGSGWTTALLADLVGPDGQVIGVERIPRLVQTSRTALAGFDRPWAQVRRAEPDVLGVPGHAPFARILVSAEADELPEALLDQLAPDGVMVIPVAGEMLRVVAQPAGRRVTRHGRYRFVPLIS
ncbi:protein-L-isoaspartate O-methyltransferase family protein [Janibacter cremeus]|uniref:Protein-L-isoaspartate O-methyltransferase n=1 Tax=Janibacter cremeus TaxID=1285192 RepID=A0A852VKB5_9MICO|nr:protein-L-isoaspartate O-methyltransferase [Janibacter cremeus]NYF97547.1 protein-L-isoaspartate(D-aspartate) O-methyltransferase [Janibacter cremeus]